MMHRKYYKLRHPGESLGGVTPLVSPGWIQMFSTAWMPPGFMMPDHLEFEPSRIYGWRGSRRSRPPSIGKIG